MICRLTTGLHKPRAGGPFMALNCGALPESVELDGLDPVVAFEFLRNGIGRWAHPHPVAGDGVSDEQPLDRALEHEVAVIEDPDRLGEPERGRQLDAVRRNGIWPTTAHPSRSTRFS